MKTKRKWYLKKQVEVALYVILAILAIAFITQIVCYSIDGYINRPLGFVLMLTSYVIASILDKYTR